jgi:hypothetical protein
MNPDLDARLCESYPDIFKSAQLQNGKLAWHFECEDGWFFIIDTLCTLITSHRLRSGDQQVRAYQVKEKFGTLQFGYDGGDSYIEGLVDMATSLSGTICETCGQKGGITERDGWLSTRCPEHVELAPATA